MRELAFIPISPGLEASHLDGFPGEEVTIRRAIAGAPLILPEEKDATVLLLAGDVCSGAACYGPGDCLVGTPVGQAKATSAATPCLCLTVRETGHPGSARPRQDR